jgi:hypothetical protein
MYRDYGRTKIGGDEEKKGVEERLWDLNNQSTSTHSCCVQDGPLDEAVPTV